MSNRWIHWLWEQLEARGNEKLSQWLFSDDRFIPICNSFDFWSTCSWFWPWNIHHQKHRISAFSLRCCWWLNQSLQIYIFSFDFLSNTIFFKKKIIGNSIHILFITFIFLLDQIMILQQYHKSRNLTKKEISICRFLPAKLSKILLKFLIFIKPLEGKFSRLLSGNDQSFLQATTFLFTSKGTPMTAEMIRKSFCATAAYYQFPKLNLSGYRFYFSLFRCLSFSSPLKFFLIKISLSLNLKTCCYCIDATKHSWPKFEKNCTHCLPFFDYRGKSLRDWCEPKSQPLQNYWGGM